MLKNSKGLKPSEIEEKILNFWREKKIFEKSIKKKAPKGDYVFYDGPPFATGTPHYGHILASIIKDVVPRYQTMKGKRVPRRWGWDCHGLPIENEIEKELRFKTKKDIENFGIEKFNKKARSSVLRYADEWKKIIPRIGRWIDMENDYKTMDAEYTESIWWVFKKLYDLGLVYSAYRVAPYCPRCGTPLSNFELNQPDAYRDVEDQSVYIKFKLESKPNTYFLVWTTTPWTLPGNTALAVGPKIDYVKISHQKENLILASKRLATINGEYKILEKYRGKDLVDQKYEPLYKMKLEKPGHKVVAADFVSVEDGTGIVHIAPAFGEEDMNLGRQEKLPTVITVDLEGKIMRGLGIPGENLFVKKADEEIKKDLIDRKLLYKEEKIVHSYPHCWRCDTPLLYYPVSSWYIAVTKIKKQIIKNNLQIRWVPEHIKKGRFGKWLEEIRDWDVARTRFWGAALPIWQCQKCKKVKVIGSVEDIKKNTETSNNKYFIMRHGQAENNVLNIESSNYKNNHHLTEKGKREVKSSLNKLKNIDLIFSSDFIRTKETAEIIAKHFGIKRILYDKKLREVNVGILNNRPKKDYDNYFSSFEEEFIKSCPGGENLTELKNRVSEFIYEIDKKYSNKNILIIGHEYPLWLLFAGANGANIKKSIELRGGKEDFLKTAEIKSLKFTPLPHNDNFELDLHRPYIDGIKFLCSCGGKMERVSDVFDCWFESGSMPYGQVHYPFENKKFFEKNFPAEFIAEGIDQTRGWFYTLLVLSSALFNKPAFKNVIANGILLAENGQKMSKRLKNYPDPMDIVNKYGADALRLYLLSSPAVKAENLNFSEKGVDEVYKKTIMRLLNVLSFYELYADNKLKTENLKLKAENLLDKWILARLNQLVNEVSKAMEIYELDKAVRPINDFVDDLSTWYIRRSRRRFQKPENNKSLVAASNFLAYILREFGKIIAPFLPFTAEIIYKNLPSNLQAKESVHLENWPGGDKKDIDENLLKLMSKIRWLAAMALAKRAEAGIKIRQPLSELRIMNYKLRNREGLLNILKDEVNVKKVIFDNKIKNEIELDTKITAELREEGILREFTRMIQGLRQEAGYQPKDGIYLYIESAAEMEKILNRRLAELKKEVGAANIEFRRTDKFDAEEESQIDSRKIWLGIKKV